MPIKQLLISFMILILTGCSIAPAGQATATLPVSTQAVPTSIAITDGLGNSILMEKPARKIVSLSPSTTEILFAIGAGSQLVGREDNSTYPPEAEEVASVGSLFGELPTETILALEPDLVVAGEIINAEQVQALQALGLTVYWQSNPTDFDGLYENILELGQLSGHGDEALSLINDLESRVSAVSEKVAGAQSKPPVFYELDATDPVNPWTVGAGTFIDLIISMAGGTNVASDLEPYAQISSEELIARDPAIILLSDAMFGVTPESVAARPGWDVIQAVKDNAIHGIDPNIMSVPGPRLVEGLEETARLIHPELFE